MQRSRRRLRRLRTSQRQFDLGLTRPPATPATPPAWCALPEPTQRMLAGLLTRLLVAHAGGLAPELQARSRGDADER